MPFTIMTYRSARDCFAKFDGRDLDEVEEGMFYDVACDGTSAVATVLRAEVSIDDVTVTEGNSGLRTATFTVSLNLVRPGDSITVDFATANGMATSPGDFTATSGTLNFASGETTKQLDVSVQGDGLYEYDETFTVDLSNPSNAAITDGSGLGTVRNDDAPPSVTIDDQVTSEGDTAMNFTVTLSKPIGRLVDVSYATADGTARAGSDYTAASGTLTFANGATTKQIPVGILGDVIDEEDETLTVQLSSPQAIIADGSGLGTITDDDAAPALSIDDQTLVEGDSGTTSMTLTVTLSAASGKTITVNYATTDGTARASSDYLAASGTLSIPPGNLTGQTSVSIVGDLVDELDETFTLNLSNASNAVITDGSGTGTILDNKPLATAVSAGGAPHRGVLAEGHTCALTTGGVKCWGRNAEGQLGDGTTTQRLAPVDVSGLPSGVVAISAGGDHTCALTTGGAMKCWGLNDYGQLGDGTTAWRNTPVDVSGLSSGVVSISAGAYHTCALTNVGAVKCWGMNDYGQLGDGTTTQRSTPVSVAGLSSGMAAVSAGAYHTCAVTNVGAVKCWGENSEGALGDGTRTRRLIPVDVSGLLSGVAAVSAGGSHSCAMTTWGAVKCWGSNFHTQLGDGTNIIRRLTPVDVAGLSTGVAAIDEGWIHSCALTTGGGVKCWGWGAGAVPADVTGLSSGVAAVSDGATHACAVTTGGGVKCWGDNSAGQLGDGTTTTPAAPVSAIGIGELTIGGFAPPSGPVGTVVSVSGTAFRGATQVMLNGLNVLGFTVVSDTEIRLTVPASATSGKITVARGVVKATSSTSFSVTGGGP
jgi:hypothetical protein